MNRRHQLTVDFTEQETPLPHPLHSVNLEQQNLLKTFGKKLKLATPVHFCQCCKQQWPNMEIFKIAGFCRRCQNEKKMKKLSANNDMDLGIVPDELQGLTLMEQMLIAQIHPIVSCYLLKGGTLPRLVSSVETLILCYDAADGTRFRDFRVCRFKVQAALQWLIRHKKYYRQIHPNRANLKALPLHGNVHSQLPPRTVLRATLDLVGPRTEPELLVQAVRDIANGTNSSDSPEHLLQWPACGDIRMAFPHLFPHGTRAQGSGG
ncbi:hypothetical protein DFS34DRAFT_668475 [Phlyctochytrium arcticum]|nr:hypothetical protein DFS34DRAFT_668475 [Phlyctochytrium arcticum]